MCVTQCVLSFSEFPYTRSGRKRNFHDCPLIPATPSVFCLSIRRKVVVTYTVGYRWEVVTILLSPAPYFHLLYPLSQRNLFSKNKIIQLLALAFLKPASDSYNRIKIVPEQTFLLFPRKKQNLSRKKGQRSTGQAFLGCLQVGLVLFLPQGATWQVRKHDGTPDEIRDLKVEGTNATLSPAVLTEVSLPSQPRDTADWGKEAAVLGILHFQKCSITDRWGSLGRVQTWAEKGSLWPFRALWSG